jgi:putative hydrolase of the HAD superfamily
MPNIKHVWFDFAGTLYKETPEFHKVHDELRYLTYARITGVSDMEEAKREYKKMYDKHGSNSAVFRSLGKSSDFWMKTQEDLDHSQILQPDPVVITTLDKIRTIMPISIFSNFRQGQIEEILEHLEIQIDWFTNIITGDDIAERKPALDGFYEMVKRSNVPAGELLYVGDRVDVDIKPAKSVGMKTCLIYSNSEDTDYSVNSFTNILEIIGIEN